IKLIPGLERVWKGKGAVLTSRFQFTRRRTARGLEVRLRQLDIVRAAIEGQLGNPEGQALFLRIILANELTVHPPEERRRGLQRAGIGRTQCGTGVQIKDALALGDPRISE